MSSKVMTMMDGGILTKHLETILKKMCKMVGADYDKIDFKSYGWYLKYEWSAEKEKEFVVWLAKYLKDKPSAFREMSSSHILGNHRIMSVAKEFVYTYGWKTKMPEETKDE